MTGEEYRALVATDFERDPKDLLFEIYKEALNAEQESAGRISKTMAKASTLFARLSADLKRVHRSIRRLTIWLVLLTVAISILTIPLAYHAYLVIKEHHEATKNTTTNP